MGATTSNRGYPYPSSTDDVDPPGDLQALAAAIDLDVETLAPAWQSYTPLLYTAMSTTRASISRTVTFAQYLQLPGFVIAQADVLAGAGSTGGCGLQLPVAATAGTVIGSGLITGSGASSPQSGCAFLASSLDAIVLEQPNTAFTDIASGQRFRMSVLYRTI